MYLIYADESGDTGLSQGGTPFFVVSALIVHETQWNELFQRLVDFRRMLSKLYKVPQRIALHAFDIVNGHGDFHFSQYGVTPTQRFKLYRDVLEFVAQLPQVRVLNVFIRKDRISSPATDVFQQAWTLFIQRCHNSLDVGGVLHRSADFSLLFTDRTQDDELRKLMRRMRAFNYVPSQIEGEPPRKIPVKRILDDPIPRPSPHSYYIQIADMIAFALARRDYPRAALKKYGFEAYFDLLAPVLLKEASRYDPQGIVYWPRNAQ